MAGSRLDKYGTIFTRVGGLLRSGAMKRQDKPIWFDVCEAFPPHVEPKRHRPVPQEGVQQILYREDLIRAKFYKEYGSPGLIDLLNTSTSYKCLSQRFVDKYLQLERKEDSLSGHQLMAETEAALNTEGIMVKNQTRDGKEMRERVEESEPVQNESKKGRGIDVSRVMED